MPLPCDTAMAQAGNPDVVLAHDYLLVMRGAERVFAAIADLFPGAPIFTLLYDEQALGRRFDGHAVTPSPLQRLGIRQHDFRRLLPLYPLATARLRLPPCEVVLSSSKRILAVGRIQSFSKIAFAAISADSREIGNRRRLDWFGKLNENRATRPSPHADPARGRARADAWSRSAGMCSWPARV